LDLRARLHLDGVGDALSQVIGIIGYMQVAHQVYSVVENLCGAPWFENVVSELALNGYCLEIARNLVEHEVGVHAPGRQYNDLRVVLAAKEDQSGTFPGDPSRAVFDHIFSWLALEISNKRHDYSGVGPALRM
jgi:hypothetical protein